MTNINGADEKSDALLYEIMVKGILDAYWSDWLGGLEISHDEHGNSLLTGVIPDQAALHGILNQIRDLGLTLIAINPQGMDDQDDGENDENFEQ